MNKLINSIIDKNYKEAEASLKEELASLVERKLGEKKKQIVAGETPFKTEVERTGSVKAQRKPLKGVTKVLKDVKEAVIQKDGLVHLATGEAVLPSVYRQRRWLSEASGGKAHFFDQWETVKEKLPKGHEGHKHLKMAQNAAENDDMEKAVEHLEHAAKMARSLKEDCGLDKEKEDKIHAALEKAKMLLQPELDTTAPRVDRTKLVIPKGTRRGDRLSAPDLGPKEDEWMHGKQIDEVLDTKKKIDDYKGKAVISQTKNLSDVQRAEPFSKLAMKLSKSIKNREKGIERANEKKKKLDEALQEAVSRKHFRDVANLLKEIPDEKKRKELAHHHAGIFAEQNPRFDKKRFLDAAGVKEDE